MIPFLCIWSMCRTLLNKYTLSVTDALNCVYIDYTNLALQCELSLAFTSGVCELARR